MLVTNICNLAQGYNLIVINNQQEMSMGHTGHLVVPGKDCRAIKISFENLLHNKPKINKFKLNYIFFLNFHDIKSSIFRTYFSFAAKN